MGAALAAFAVVFVAEFGDRTQLLVVSLASRHHPAPVFGGLALGYSLTTLLSVTVGAAIGSALPDRAVGVASGLLFLAFAVWTMVDEDDDDDEQEDAHRHHGPWRLVLTLAGAIMVSEVGDKSMLATATLAAESSPVPVAIGALSGILVAGGLGIALGRFLADRVDHGLLRRVSALLFTAFGVVLLVGALTG